MGQDDKRQDNSSQPRHTPDSVREEASASMFLMQPPWTLPMFDINSLDAQHEAGRHQPPVHHHRAGAAVAIAAAFLRASEVQNVPQALEQGLARFTEKRDGFAVDGGIHLDLGLHVSESPLPAAPRRRGRGA